MSAIQRYFSLSQCSLHWPSLLIRFPHSISRTNDKSNASFNAQEQFCLPASNTCHLCRYSGYFLTQRLTKTKLLKHTLLSSSQTQSLSISISHVYHLSPCLRQTHVSYLLTNSNTTKSKSVQNSFYRCHPISSSDFVVPL